MLAGHGHFSRSRKPPPESTGIPAYSGIDSGWSRSKARCWEPGARRKSCEAMGSDTRAGMTDQELWIFHMPLYKKKVVTKFLRVKRNCAARITAYACKHLFVRIHRNTCVDRFGRQNSGFKPSSTKSSAKQPRPINCPHSGSWSKRRRTKRHLKELPLG